jgi:hypothetical protein
VHGPYEQVNLTLRVLCRPDMGQLSTIHMNLGRDSSKLLATSYDKVRETT